MINYLTESAVYKVYALYESVYLKHKPSSLIKDDYDPADKFIACHYGDPTSALITSLDRHIIVSGCGLSIYSTEHDYAEHILDEPDSRWWTDALHKGMSDDGSCEFRFVSFNEADRLRVFRMNLLTRQIEQLD
jgi:hypothetical protein